MAATKSKSAKKPVSKAVQGPSEKSASKKDANAKKDSGKKGGCC
tara:strand:+ start:584 stop:715 length:132 start_codon:yes stop_codon:yes gene_type:complete